MVGMKLSAVQGGLNKKLGCGQSSSIYKQCSRENVIENCSKRKTISSSKPATKTELKQQVKQRNGSKTNLSKSDITLSNNRKTKSLTSLPLAGQPRLSRKTTSTSHVATGQSRSVGRSQSCTKTTGSGMSREEQRRVLRRTTSCNRSLIATKSENRVLIPKKKSTQANDSTLSRTRSINEMSRKTPSSELYVQNSRDNRLPPTQSSSKTKLLKRKRSTSNTKNKRSSSTTKEPIINIDPGHFTVTARVPRPSMRDYSSDLSSDDARSFDRDARPREGYGSEFTAPINKNLLYRPELPFHRLRGIGSQNRKRQNSVEMKLHIPHNSIDGQSDLKMVVEKQDPPSSDQRSNPEEQQFIIKTSDNGVPKELMVVVKETSSTNDVSKQDDCSDLDELLRSEKQITDNFIEANERLLARIDKALGNMQSRSNIHRTPRRSSSLDSGSHRTAISVKMEAMPEKNKSPKYLSAEILNEHQKQFTESVASNCSTSSLQSSKNDTELASRSASLIEMIHTRDLGAARPDPGGTKSILNEATYTDIWKHNTQKSNSSEVTDAGIMISHSHPTDEVARDYEDVLSVSEEQLLKGQSGKNDDDEGAIHQNDMEAGATMNRHSGLRVLAEQTTHVFVSHDKLCSQLGATQSFTAIQHPEHIGEGGSTIRKIHSQVDEDMSINNEIDSRVSTTTPRTSTVKSRDSTPNVLVAHDEECTVLRPTQSFTAIHHPFLEEKNQIIQQTPQVYCRRSEAVTGQVITFATKTQPETHIMSSNKKCDPTSFAQDFHHMPIKHHHEVDGNRLGNTSPTSCISHVRMRPNSGEKLQDRSKLVVARATPDKSFNLRPDSGNEIGESSVDIGSISDSEHIVNLRNLEGDGIERVEQDLTPRSFNEALCMRDMTKMQGLPSNGNLHADAKRHQSTQVLETACSSQALTRSECFRIENESTPTSSVNRKNVEYLSTKGGKFTETMTSNELSNVHEEISKYSMRFSDVDSGITMSSGEKLSGVNANKSKESLTSSTTEMKHSHQTQGYASEDYFMSNKTPANTKRSSVDMYSNNGCQTNLNDDGERKVSESCAKRDEEITPRNLRKIYSPSARSVSRASTDEGSELESPPTSPYHKRTEFRRNSEDEAIFSEDKETDFRNQESNISRLQSTLDFFESGEESASTISSPGRMHRPLKSKDDISDSMNEDSVEVCHDALLSPNVKRMHTGPTSKSIIITRNKRLRSALGNDSNGKNLSGSTPTLNDRFLRDKNPSQVESNFPGQLGTTQSASALSSADTTAKKCARLEQNVELDKVLKKMTTSPRHARKLNMVSENEQLLKGYEENGTERRASAERGLKINSPHRGVHGDGKSTRLNKVNPVGENEHLAKQQSDCSVDKTKPDAICKAIGSRTSPVELRHGRSHLGENKYDDDVDAGFNSKNKVMKPDTIFIDKRKSLTSRQSSNVSKSENSPRSKATKDCLDNSRKETLIERCDSYEPQIPNGRQEKIAKLLNELSSREITASNLSVHTCETQINVPGHLGVNHEKEQGWFENSDKNSPPTGLTFVLEKNERIKQRGRKGKLKDRSPMGRYEGGVDITDKHTELKVKSRSVFGMDGVLDQKTRCLTSQSEKKKSHLAYTSTNSKKNSHGNMENNTESIDKNLNSACDSKQESAQQKKTLPMPWLFNKFVQEKNQVSQDAENNYHRKEVTTPSADVLTATDQHHFEELPPTATCTLNQGNDDLQNELNYLDRILSTMSSPNAQMKQQRPAGVPSLHLPNEDDDDGDEDNCFASFVNENDAPQKESVGIKNLLPHPRRSRRKAVQRLQAELDEIHELLESLNNKEPCNLAADNPGLPLLHCTTAVSKPNPATHIHSAVKHHTPPFESTYHVIATLPGVAHQCCTSPKEDAIHPLVITVPPLIQSRANISRNYLERLQEDIQDRLKAVEVQVSPWPPIEVETILFKIEHTFKISHPKSCFLNFTIVESMVVHARIVCSPLIRFHSAETLIDDQEKSVSTKDFFTQISGHGIPIEDFNVTQSGVPHRPSSSLSSMSEVNDNFTRQHDFKEKMMQTKPETCEQIIQTVDQPIKRRTQAVQYHIRQESKSSQMSSPSWETEYLDLLKIVQDLQDVVTELNAQIRQKTEESIRSKHENVALLRLLRAVGFHYDGGLRGTVVLRRPGRTKIGNKRHVLNCWPKSLHRKKPIRRITKNQEPIKFATKHPQRPQYQADIRGLAVTLISEFLINNL